VAAKVHILPFAGLLLFDNTGLLCYVSAMKVEWDGKVFEFGKPMQVSRILEHFSLSREAYLVIVNGKLVTEDSLAASDDRVRLVRVVSGG
jgi:sulfur carrier protein ThiS